MRRIREAGSRRNVRRGLIAALFAIPVVFIATTMPMQAMGNPVSPASAGDAQLVLSQTDSQDPVTEGDNVTYTVNIGVDPETSTGDATDVIVDDYLSEDVSFVEVEADFAECFYDSESHLVECDFGTLHPDETQTAYVTVQTTDSCTGGGDLRSFALSEPCTIYNDVYADSPDSTGQQFDEEDTTVNPASGPNLHISKSDDPDPVQELNPLTYTIDVNNNGDANATQTTVTDHLPAGTSFVSASTTQGNCTHTATTVTCHLGTLVVSSEGGESVTIVVQAPNVTGDTVITNDADVSASNADTASTSEDTTVLASNGTSASGEVPPNTNKPVTFTTGTQSSGGQAAVTGTDKTAVSLIVPPGGPGGSVSLDEVPCPTAPCTGAAAARDTEAQAAASAGTVVLGGVAFDVVPPDNYPNSKPFRAILLWDKTLGARKSPVFYFKQGVTPNEITLAHCGQTPPNTGKPCVLKNEKITTGPAIVRGDWKVVVRINSDPRMRK